MASKLKGVVKMILGGAQEYPKITMASKLKGVVSMMLGTLEVQARVKVPKHGVCKVPQLGIVILVLCR